MTGHEAILGYLLRQRVAAVGSVDEVVKEIRKFAEVRGGDGRVIEDLARRLIGDLKAMWADAADGSLDYVRRE